MARDHIEYGGGTPGQGTDTTEFTDNAVEMQGHPRKAKYRGFLDGPTVFDQSMAMLMLEQDAALAEYGVPLVSDSLFALDNRVGTEREPLTKRLRTVDDLCAMPPLDWLVEDVLPTGALGVLVGKPAAGKTFVALDVALSVASGRDWHGRTTRAGGVVYVVAEGVRGVGQRIAAWVEQTGVRPAEFHALAGAVNLLDAAQSGELVAICRRLAPALVVIDTLARSMPGADENAVSDMGQVVESAAKITAACGAAVLFVHHVGKSGQIRGSTALSGAVDVEITASRAENTLTLKCGKQKDGEEFAPIYLRLAGAGDSCVLEAIDRPRRSALTESQCQALEILTTFGPKGASLKQWNVRWPKDRSTLSRARTALVANGLVTELRDGRYRAVGLLAEDDDE